MARKMANKSKSVLSVDFSNVQEVADLPEGTYQVKVDEITKKQSDKSGKYYLAFVFKVMDAEYKDTPLYHNCSLQPQALFNLKRTLEALGVDIPKNKIKIDLKKIIGMTCAAQVEIETYQGKDRPKIVELIPLGSLQEDDEGWEDEEDEEDEEEL